MTRICVATAGPFWVSLPTTKVRVTVWLARSICSTDVVVAAYSVDPSSDAASTPGVSLSASDQATVVLPGENAITLFGYFASPAPMEANTVPSTGLRAMPPIAANESTVISDSEGAAQTCETQ